MLDVRQVLARKEKDIERLRREIGALQRVIHLLEEDHSRSPSAMSVAKKRPSSGRRPAEISERGMAELELYYPFVGRNAERR
jgi:hypothetical protein